MKGVVVFLFIFLSVLLNNWKCILVWSLGIFKFVIKIIFVCIYFLFFFRCFENLGVGCCFWFCFIYFVCCCMVVFFWYRFMYVMVFNCVNVEDFLFFKLDVCEIFLWSMNYEVIFVGEKERWWGGGSLMEVWLWCIVGWGEKIFFWMICRKV